MQLSQSVRLKQKQSLVMTPQLQQAIRLLQMTNVELTDYLEEQALENPFLEVTTAGEDSIDKKSPQDTPIYPRSDTAETPATLDSMSEVRRSPMIRPSIMILRTGFPPKACSLASRVQAAQLAGQVVPIGT